MKSRKLGALLISLLCTCPMDAIAAGHEISAEPPLQWWKGNLHTHTFWSDGNDFPDMVADWYLNQGYHFLALSDHNVLSQGEQWLSLEEVGKRSLTRLTMEWPSI